MNWKQRALYSLMSDISEGCYCAGWMGGNEFTLWGMVSDQKSSRNYGQDVVKEEQIAELRAISTEIGGWIRWRDDEEDANLPPEQWGPVFVPMEEWLRIYEKRLAEWASLRHPPRVNPTS